MCILKNLVVVIAVLITGDNAATAQSGTKLREPLPSISDVYADQCRLCDSLADAYLFAGDTSMAIYYYQQYIDAHSDESELAGSVIKLKKLFYNRRQSFYLIDY
jgi:hypothetical protein